MADLNRKMAEGHTVSDLDTVIDEVYGAHGDYDTLGDRLDDIDTIIDTAKLGIHYKGEVNYYSNLPTTGVSIGDAYTVKYAGSSGTTPDGTEYVWGTVSGTNQWINFSKDSYTKAEVDALLALKQNALSSTQLDAVNSGIDSTKVEQIETNKNNTSLLEQMNGAKNLAPYNSDEYIGNAGYWFIHSNCIDILAGTSVYIVFNYTQTAGQFSVQLTDSNGNAILGTYVYSTAGTTSGHKEAKITIPAGKTAKGYNSYLNTNATVSIFNFMIVPAEIYEAGFTDYQPYAMSNVELTAQWSSKQVSKWATSFSVPNPSFGRGELIKLYVYGGNPASLAMYLITSNTVVPLTSTTGISYTIQTNKSVDFTTTSTCLAYYEYIRFATS